MHVAKTKALISIAVTAKLICVFVFAYAKSRFSHDEAQISLCHSVKRTGFMKQLSSSKTSLKTDIPLDSDPATIQNFCQNSSNLSRNGKSAVEA